MTMFILDNIMWLYICILLRFVWKYLVIYIVKSPFIYYRTLRFILFFNTDNDLSTAWVIIISNHYSDTNTVYNRIRRSWCIVIRFSSWIYDNLVTSYFGVLKQLHNRVDFWSSEIQITLFEISYNYSFSLF